MTNYIVVAKMHSGKCVIKVFKKFKELKEELQREKELRAYYKEMTWESKNGKFNRVCL